MEDLGNSLLRNGSVKSIEIGEESFDLTAFDQVWNSSVLPKLREHKFKNKVWRDFGFQANDMSTDFRASGLFGCTQLSSFAKSFPDSLQKARNIECEWFFLALISIRLTHSMMIMFQLMAPEDRKKVPPNKRALSVKRSSFKNVFRMAVIAEDETGSPLTLFNTMHSFAVRHCINQWLLLFKDLKPGKSNAYIVHLNQCTEKASEHSEKLLQKLAAIRAQTLQEFEASALKISD